MNLAILRETPPWDWPDDAGDRFLALLRNDQTPAADRLIAAELAGDFSVINDALAEALLAVACRADQAEDLRAQAAISLGPALEHVSETEFDDPHSETISKGMYRRVQDSLRALCEDVTAPTMVRRRALEASVRAPEDWHRDAIATAYASADENWMLTAVFCMVYVRGFEEQILEALGSRNEDVRYEAIRAAGTWDIDAAWDHVAPIVTATDAPKPLRLVAIEAVASIRPEEAQLLLSELVDEEDDDINDAVYEALATAEALSENDEEGAGDGAADGDEEDDDAVF
jgi:hypothetical protein